MAVELYPGVFEATAVDLRSVLKGKLKVHRRISNVLQLDLLPLDIRQLDIEVQL